MEYIYGCDETLKAPVIGSIPVAIVKIPKNLFKKKIAKDLIIRDSKLMTKNQITKTFNALQFEIEYSIEHIYPYKMGGNNLIDLEVGAIIDGLMKLDYHDEPVYIDLFDSSRENLIRRFKEQGFFANFDKWIIEHGADEKYKVVSLASIVSRMENLNQYKAIKKNHDIGSGCCSDKQTIKYVIENFENPPWFVRTSWTTYRRLIDDDIRKKVLKDITNSKPIKYLYKGGKKKKKKRKNV